MTHLKEYEKGDTPRIKATVTDTTGAVVSPDTKNGEYQISIEVKDSDTDSVMTQSRMDSISDTQFSFEWPTTEGMTRGEYEVEVRSTVSGEQVLNRDLIKLVDII